MLTLCIRLHIFNGGNDHCTAAFLVSPNPYLCDPNSLALLGSIKCDRLGIETLISFMISFCVMNNVQNMFLSLSTFLILHEEHP